MNSISEVCAPPDPTAQAALLSTAAIAGVWRRIAALLLDMLLVGVGIFIIHHLASPNQAAAVAAVPLQGFLFVLYILYLHARYGQTVGKRVMRIKVVTVDGAPVGLARSARRSIITGLESMPWVMVTMLAYSQIPESQYLPLQPQHMRDLELALRPGWYATCDWIIFWVFVAELASCFLTARRQSLSDLVAGTMVVRVHARGAFQ